MRAKLLVLSMLLAGVALACEWDPKRPLEHYAPAVDEALFALDAGDASVAAHVLAGYLDSNTCDKGQIAISKALEEKSRAGLDLGLVLFRIAESYGKRFTEDAHDEQTPPAGERSDHVTCALAVVRALADSGAPIDRARAAFVEGNLLFFNGAYKDAVPAYDRALVLVPPAEGDDTSLGADIAFNRAIALRRSKEEPDAGRDGGDDDASPGDGGENDAASDDASTSNDGGESDSPDAAPDNAPDAEPPPQSPDAGTPPPNEEDAGSEDAGAPPQPPPPEELQDAGTAPPPEALDRLLDELERAPTVQQEVIRRERSRRIKPEDDK